MQAGSNLGLKRKRRRRALAGSFRDERVLKFVQVACLGGDHGWEHREASCGRLDSLLHCFPWQIPMRRGSPWF